MKVESFNQKIGLVVANNRFGGQEKRYFKIAYKLYTEGYNVQLYAHDNLRNENNSEINELLNNLEFSKRITFIKAPRILKKIYKEFFYKNLFLLRLNKYLIKDNIDITITNKDLKSLDVLKSSNTKIIKDFTSPDDIDLFFQTKDYKFIRNVDHFFFISESVYNRFNNLDKLSERSENITNYSTFSLPFYAPPINETSHLDEKNKSIVFAHRFIERKNPKLFAQAIKILLRDPLLKDWKIFFLGRGPLFGELKEMLQYEIEKGDVVLTYTSKLNSHLKKSSIFVSLIEPDNFPSQSVLEAMHFKNALIVLNSGTSFQFIQENGLLVEKSKDDINKKIKQLIQSDLQLSCKNSQHLLENKFSSDKYIQFLVSEIGKISA
jgi:glycosyltransferase involved in cell wall biosynthesis